MSNKLEESKKRLSDLYLKRERLVKAHISPVYKEIKEVKDLILELEKEGSMTSREYEQITKSNETSINNFNSTSTAKIEYVYINQGVEDKKITENKEEMAENKKKMSEDEYYNYVEELFSKSSYKKYDGCRIMKGLQIISKYIDVESNDIVCWVGDSELWSVDLSELIKKDVPEEEFQELNNLGWSIKDGSLITFV